MALIYKVTHIESGKAYVGQTLQSLPKRWGQHQRDARRPGRGTALGHAILKYGPSAFCVGVVEGDLPPEALNDREAFWVKELKTLTTQGGYNIREGGGSQGALAEETKRKIADKATGRKRSEESKRRQSEQLKGRALTPEWRQKIGAGQLGNRRGPETGAKISARFGVSPGDKERVVSLFREGLNWLQISRRTGWSRPTVKRWVAETLRAAVAAP